jgi:hypothetical protein
MVQIESDTVASLPQPANGNVSKDSNALVNIAYDSKKFQDCGKGPASSFNGYGRRNNR